MNFFASLCSSHSSATSSAGGTTVAVATYVSSSEGAVAKQRRASAGRDALRRDAERAADLASDMATADGQLVAGVARRGEMQVAVIGQDL